MDSSFRNFFASLWPWFTTRRQSLSLLRLIAVGIEEKLPLAPLVEAWAEDERGFQRARLRTLARLLGTGMALDDAIEEVPGVLNSRHLLALRFDRQMGTRTAAAQAILQEDPSPPLRQPGISRSLFYLYICIVPPFVLLFIFFFHFNITPKLTRILGEFSVPQPDVFVWWRMLGDLVVQWTLPMALLALAALWFLISTRAGLRLGRNLTGRLSHSARHRYTSDVLQLLGVAVATGRPLAGTLSTLARYHFDPAIRQQLLFARNEVEQGVDVWQTLVDSSLLTRSEAHLLHTGQRLGNQPWTMSQIVAVKRQRARRRQALSAVFLWPLAILTLGSVVLFEALSVFIPVLEIMRVL
jgi:type II secretory pathway component PulF